MAQYRKKPVVIEAVQWTGGPDQEEPVWARDALRLGKDRGFEMPLGAMRVIHNKYGVAYCMAIQTLEGTMRAQFGDWIIRGIKGEIYPCKPDIFEATYEPA